MSSNIETRIYSRENGNIQISDLELLRFIELEGFKRYDVSSKKTILVRVTQGCIISEVNPSIILETVRAKLENDSSPDAMKAFEIFLKKDYSNQGFIKQLVAIDIKILRSTKEVSVFYYQNGIVRVTKEDFQILCYEDFTEGYIWRNQIISRDFNLEFIEETSVFAQFIYNVSGLDEERFTSLKTIIGYLLNDFKNPSYPKAVVLLDEDVDINEAESNGGKGKSLFVEGLKQIQPTYFKDGKQLDSKNRFMFSGVENHHRILFFDDVHREFDFERLFSVITGEFPVEKKYQDAITIPFSESPKVIISSNYILTGKGGNSYERRKVNFEFSSYYGENLKPDEEFGHQFFRDWSTYEWTLFDQFMLSCTQFFMNKGVIAPKSINILENELKMAVPKLCIDYLDVALEEGEFDKSDVYQAYQSQCSDLNTSPHRFTKWLKKWVKARSFELSEFKSNGTQKITLTKNEFND